MLRYYQPLKGLNGITGAVSYNYRNVQHQNSTSITPEIGYCYECINLSYGYNFFPGDRYAQTWHHRVAFRLILQ